ncbi:uncharacterized protein [Chelonus insularis]|uniref:uncharacterized protein n=1 Tax=Chelonus insularis TaxID=460826 RepID=UPI00158D56F1|nr:uncharacterized protein LOC118070982 [Chelonus insularis]
MLSTTMVDNNCIIEGNVKFRDGKKWKSRWCVMRKLSPVADCLHLQLYGDSKDRYKQGQTKASLSLQHFLGIESGFTLDKESNTIAIICQDLIVVLAFDTRERLIQWQVKISSNLGEDQQFLIIISSAPSKAKVANGPAHLHIQDRRFCLTVGVPPRLVGVWEIAHLRRYGVVEGRFCFEGGSRCGRGEGLHVLITDQGDDIVKTLQLAAEGKLATRKRPLGRELSAQDSPRRQFIRSDTRASDFFPSTVSYTTTTTYKEQFESCKTETSPCWSSTESRHHTELDGDYSCRETSSVTELTDQQTEWRNGSLPRQNTSGLERCSSCISKLGAISKNPSGNTTTTLSSTSGNHLNNPGCHLQQPRAFDRLSLSSYSSSSHDSDYSGSQNADSSVCVLSKTSPVKEQPDQQQQQQQQQPQQQLQIQQTAQPQQQQKSLSPSPTTLPPRPQKPSTAIMKTKKPPMPLPNEQICTCKSKNAVTRVKSSPYENYDIPKTILAHHMSLEPPTNQGDQYYDTPRKIKECLALPKNYPNYDTPHTPQAVMLQQCGCPAKMSALSPRSLGCPCHNVMSWAGFVLPYCRRGAGIEPTGVAVHPVKLSGEGKMPVVNANGELAIYPSGSKEFGNNHLGSCAIKNENDYLSKSTTNNYENVEPVIDTQPESKRANYVNIDFTESLEHYENSRDLITRMGISQEEMEEIADGLKDRNNEEDNSEQEVDKVCNKCGHVKDNATNYLQMDPDKQLKKPFPGYLPMQPAHNACSKEVISRICGGTKSSSNPTLFGSSSLIEGNRKRSDSELRIPGSAMLSSPYLRRRLIDPSHSIDGTASLEMLWRKRSYSAESAHYLEDSSPGFSSSNVIHKCSSETDKSSLINKDQPIPCINSDLKVNRDCDESSGVSQPFSIKIRRSSSVPSKAGHNRDSSSSNDSGVSTGSLSHRNAEFVEFEYSLTPISSSRKQNILTICRKSPPPVCYHSSLPRKSKSSDPLRELSFQFQKIKIPTKSSSAEGDIPTCLPKSSKGFSSPGETSGTPYIDSRSTSSGTSDMSDYIETLSLSSHSSSDTPDSLRLGGRAVTTTLRPRSGKEYYKLDRSILTEQGRATTTTTPSSYANITPVLEKSESPSPGYMSSSSFEQPLQAREHFLFPEEA